MAPPKRRGGSRVTPKGTQPGQRPARPSDSGSHGFDVTSARYTPPVPRELKVSPRWVPVLMFTLLALGVLVIILNYLDVLPGGTDNWYLVLGLALILGGIITATQYH